MACHKAEGDTILQMPASKWHLSHMDLLPVAEQRTASQKHKTAPITLGEQKVDATVQLQ